LKGLGTFQLHQDAQTVATEYVRAVMTNNGAYILALTHPDLRNDVKEQFYTGSFSEQQLPDEHRILVHHVKQTGPEYTVARLVKSASSDSLNVTESTETNKTAKVHLVIEHSGYQLKPDVYLEQVTDGTWYVTFVDGLKVDPRWTDQQNEQAVPVPEPPVDTELIFQETVEELREKFENREGVSVAPGI